MRKLIIYCDGGFGNRFNALTSGLALAAETGLVPQVIWPVNNWCGAAFEDIYEDELPVVQRELSSFVQEKDQYEYFIVEDRLGLAQTWTSPLHMQNWESVNAFFARNTQDVFYYTALIPPFVDGSQVARQVRSLHLRAHIRNRAHEFLSDHGIGAKLGDFLGVQIRKTDFGENGADDNNLFELVKNCPQKTFFICSDDKAVEQRFSALPNVRIHVKRAHVEMMVPGEWTTVTTDYSGRLYAGNVNRSAQSVQDAVVDLLVLSRSQIVLTSHSTFLNTALLLQQVFPELMEPARGLTSL
jgi:hypothetical protein